jgi:hypothetical protein
MTHALTCTKQRMVRTPKRAQRGFTCALQRCRPGLVACCSRSLAQALLFLWGWAALAGPAAADPFGDTLRWPLTLEPRIMRGGFGEPRSSHFHAGLDLSTRQRTGAEVVAPADVTVERVRASGAGYGRSLYLRTRDGRLIVFGHLDAFVPGLAAFVDSAQRATGEYEVDLWPPAGRFAFAAGSRVAWSGESGAGPPHLHVEVRHGDFALNPLLAGLAVKDTVPPQVTRVVLEPLDERSWVERGAAPHTRTLRATPDTVVVEGRARLAVVASDRTNDSYGLPVRITGARWRDTWAESRMDSVSWAGEMSQLEWLLDVGRMTGSDGVILDAPAGWRPRFLASSQPESLAVDLITVEPGAMARPLELWATDAAGNTSSRQLWLRGPRADELGPGRRASPPDPPLRAKRGKRRLAATPARATLPRWEFAALPARRLRVRVTRAPAALRDVRIERGAPRGLASDSALATWDGRAWSAVLDLSNTPDPDGLTIRGTRADGTAWWQRGSFALWPSGTGLPVRVEDWAEAKVELERVYDAGVLVARPTSHTGLPAGATGVRATFELLPVSPPLRGAVPVTLAVPRDLAREKLGVYHRDREGEAWEWTDADWDSAAHAFRLTASRLGQFTVLRDTTPPAARVLVPAKIPKPGAYPTWRLAARVGDAASGVHGRRSAFTVDGVRVPTEWDAEEKVLRWRPLTPPAPGTHRYRLEVTDRAGNHTVRSGTFVIASR